MRIKNNKKAKASLRKFLRLCLVQMLVISLAHYPLPISAADSQNNTASNVAGAITAVGGIAQNILKQQQQQQAAMAMQAQLQSQYGHFLNGELIPTESVYFPHCKLPLALPPLADGLCEDIAHPLQLTMAEQYANRIETVYLQSYDQYSKFDENTRTPIGLQCIQQALNNEDAKMQKKIDSITMLKARIEIENKDFKDKLKEMKKEIQISYDDLYGQKGKEDLDDPRDFTKYFDDSACQSALAPGTVSGSRQKGFAGVQATLNSVNQSAKDLDNNKEAYKADLEKQITRIENAITKNGIQAWAGGSRKLDTKGLTQFGGLESVVNRSIEDFSDTYGRASSYLKDEMGYDLPAVDTQFEGKLASFSQTSNSFFKNKVITDCVTKKNESGLGLTNAQLLSSLKQEGTTSDYTTNRYREALATILASDSDLTYKKNQIIALDKKYKGSQVYANINDPLEGPQTLSPSLLYDKMIQRCETAYDEGTLISATDSSKDSYKQKVETANNYLRELKNAQKEFQSDLVSDIRSEILYCTDQNVKTAGSCGDGANMSPKSDGFCLQKAVDCSNDVRGCFNKLDTLIKERKALIKISETNYNKAVNNHLLKQQNELTIEVNKALADAEFFQQYFASSIPGPEAAAYQMPESLYIKKAEDGSDPSFKQLDVNLLGSGNPDAFLNSEGGMLAQLDKIQAIMKSQQQYMKDAVNTYMETQKKTMAENRKKLADIAKKCSTATAAIRDNATQAEMQNQQQAQEDYIADVTEYNENATNAENVCRRYDLNAAHPMCDENESLIEDALAAGAFINTAALDALYEAKTLCASNSKDSEVKEKGDEDEIEPVFAFCNDSKDAKAIIDRKISDIKSSINIYAAQINAQNSGESLTADKIEAILSAGDPEHDHKKMFNKSNAGKMINNLLSMKKSMTRNNFACSDLDDTFNKAIEGGNNTGAFLKEKAILDSDSSSASEKSAASTTISDIQDDLEEELKTNLSKAKNFGEVDWTMFKAFNADLKYLDTLEEAVAANTNTTGLGQMNFPPCMAEAEGSRTGSATWLDALEAINKQVDAATMNRGMLE